jgi:hypothetical protein
MRECSVCGTKYNESAINCFRCGFAELHKNFPAKEDYDHFIENVVLPYRQKWELSKKAPVLEESVSGKKKPANQKDNTQSQKPVTRVITAPDNIQSLSLRMEQESLIGIMRSNNVPLVERYKAFGKITDEAVKQKFLVGIMQNNSLPLAERYKAFDKISDEPVKIRFLSGIAKSNSQPMADRNKAIALLRKMGT